MLDWNKIKILRSFLIAGFLSYLSVSFKLEIYKNKHLILFCPFTTSRRCKIAELLRCRSQAADKADNQRAPTGRIGSAWLGNLSWERCLSLAKLKFQRVDMSAALDQTTISQAVTFSRMNRSTLALRRRSSPGRVSKPITSRKSRLPKKISFWAKYGAVILNSIRIQMITTHLSAIIWMMLDPFRSIEMCTRRSPKIKMEAHPTN